MAAKRGSPARPKLPLSLDPAGPAGGTDQPQGNTCMHAVLLSLVLLGANDLHATGTVVAGIGHGGHAAGGACGEGGGGGGLRSGYGARGSRRGGMPQSCYDPHYGCYAGNDRRVQRYPAFHGTYYRTPYNYRNLFDYPWHADLHEPTSLFSYNVPAEGTFGGGAFDSPPTPPAGARAPSRGPQSVVIPSNEFSGGRSSQLAPPALRRW
jgi:hypothetical protein